MSSNFLLWYSVPFSKRHLKYAFGNVDVPSDMGLFKVRVKILEALTIPVTHANIYKAPPHISIEDMATAQISMSDLGKPLAEDETPVATVFDPQPIRNTLHLIVFSADMPMPICWCIRGTDPMFEIAAQREESVNWLLGVIKESLGKSPFDPLELYKISFRDENELKTIVHTWQEGELLSFKTQNLQTAFYDVPLNGIAYVVVEDVAGANIHDMVRDATFTDRAVTAHKHIRSWDVVEKVLAKRQKVAPSKFGTSDYYKQQTDMDARRLDQRYPFKESGSIHQSSHEKSLLLDQELPPIELLYRGFGRFLDTYRAKRHSDCVVGSPILREKVELFAEQMSRVYPVEIQRQTKALPVLNGIFDGLFGSRQVIAPSSITSDKAITDGHYVLGPYNIPAFLVEFKNEAAGSTAIPTAQLSLYYERLVGAIARATPDLLRRSRLPVLGLTIIGPVVTFYAMLNVGSTVFHSLTPGLSCVLDASGGDDRRALHAAFIAANELLALIEEDAIKLSNINSLPPYLVNHFFPEIDEIPSLQDPGTSIKIKISAILQKGIRRLLYRARSADRNLDLVIKITRSYSTELHQFCAKRGHAPVLHAVKKLPGDIVVVVMEYLQGTYPGPDGSQEYRETLGRELKQLVGEFHRAGYVHGDLRVPNLFRVGDKIMLLDFDWGGRVGEAFYPPCTLTPQLTEGRDMSDLKITPDDDVRVLESSLESIGFS